MKLPDWTQQNAHETGYYLDAMSHERAMALEIVGNIFEDFLTDTGSTVPNKERDESMLDGNPDELAILYGCQYADLVEDVTSLIRTYLSQVRTS